ncbi:hypothetical protein Tco_1316295 [Tanacetum coccineum]
MQACLQIPLTGAMLMVIFVFFDCIDIDEFSVLKVSDMVNKLGYSDKVTMFYHLKYTGCDLDNGLHTLRNDSDVLTLGEYVRLGNRLIKVYVEHHTSTLDTYYQSQQSNPTPIVQPSAFVDDFYAVEDPFNGQENPVEEVEVNMDSFDRTDADNMGYEQNPREFNANDEIKVDMDVMDPDEFESASDEEGKEISNYTADDVEKGYSHTVKRDKEELF